MTDQINWLGAESQMASWTGRVDPEANSQRWHQLIQPISLGAPSNSSHDNSPGIALLGFASDAGVRRNQGRTGAAEGPLALRRALASLPVHHDAPLYECGTVVCLDDALEAAQQQLAETVGKLLDQGHLPVVLGGGHEIAFGSWSGLALHLARQPMAHAPRVGIINFDAHFDLRDHNSQRPSSGTPFSQIAQRSQDLGWPFIYACLGVSRMSNTPALFQRAESLRVMVREDLQMTQNDLPDLRQALHDFISSCDLIYLTIDMDVFPAATAPGVSAPAARGVSLEVIEPLLIMIRNSGKLRLVDLAELNPAYDTDSHTARLGARLIHQITQGYSLNGLQHHSNAT